jgi:hypothetical protein
VNYQYYYPLCPQYLLPALKYSYDDALKVSEPVTNINDYVRQSIAEFVISSRDINNDTQWNAYLRELDNMGQQPGYRLPRPPLTGSGAKATKD